MSSSARTSQCLFQVSCAGLRPGRHGHAQGRIHESFFYDILAHGEFGGMGLEGAVKAGFKKDSRPSRIRRSAKSSTSFWWPSFTNAAKRSTAAHLEIDSVIDPGTPRKWIMRV